MINVCLSRQHQLIIIHVIIYKLKSQQFATCVIINKLKKKCALGSKKLYLSKIKMGHGSVTRLNKINDGE